MMENLPELGCELDGWYFGTADESPFLVQDIAYDLGEIRTSDSPAARDHGVRFGGPDLLDGQTIIISIAGLDSPGVDQLDHYGEFRDMWRQLAEQGSNTGLSVLRMGRAGRTRRVYGRARDWLPTMGQDTAGHTVITAQFKCVDDLFYGDNEYSLTTNFLQPADGGFPVPAVAPWTSEGVSVAQGVMRVGGRRPVWPCFKVVGPITNPVVEVVGQFRLSLDLTLAAGESVGIDPRPWSRGIRRDNGVSVTSKLLPGSPQLSRLRMAPGGYEVVLRGQDPSGTAQLTTAWRETFTGP